MSHWEDIKKEDIEISDDGKTLEVYIGSDSFGNNYVEIKIEDIKELLNEANTTKKEI